MNVHREIEGRIALAVEGAENQHAGWSDTAYAYVQLFCAQNHGRRVAGHEIVNAGIAYGVIQPANRRAWGAPMRRAVKAGLIKRIGFTEDPLRPGNATALWEIK